MLKYSCEYVTIFYNLISTYLVFSWVVEDCCMLLTMNPVLLPCGVHVYSGESSWLCPSVCQFVCLYMWNVSFNSI